MVSSKRLDLGIGWELPMAFAHEDRPAVKFFRGGSKPYVRWWWLAGPFCERDIETQLTWVKQMGFGGVELAWLWPSWLRWFDWSLIPSWLGPEWSRLVAHAKRHADRIGLGCDFTFGSCWPFGGSCVARDHASQTFGRAPTQLLSASWEEPLNQELFVVDHLNHEALLAYGQTMLPAFQGALEGTPSGLFCDSLEIYASGLWSPALWDEFASEFGYRLEPLSDDLDRHLDVRYDYRKFLAEVMVREFYAPFTQFCHDQGAYSRVQCHGSPTDLLTSYSAVDVPESEALLFDPHFSRIPASAAALSNRSVVSAETFTCIYGFTSSRHTEAYRFWKREQVADLKLLADAVIANGVNQIVWHGMPYSGANCHHQFYASVHVGPDAAFVAELPAFNAYLANVCGLMQSGQTVSELAVYLPNEDMWMLDSMPRELRTPGGYYWWEMRHVIVPEETRPFQPLWVSAAMLSRAELREGRLAIGSQSFAALYLDVEWLDADGLVEIERLASAGLKVILKRRPRRPGHQPRDDYERRLDSLAVSPNTVATLAQAGLQPVVCGEDLPPYWARKTATDTDFFFAHPRAADVRYPMPYGFSKCADTVGRRVILQSPKASVDVELVFEPYQSLLLRLSQKGEITPIDCRYCPPIPLQS
jgi:hypothetical protein